MVVLLLLVFLLLLVWLLGTHLTGSKPRFVSLCVFEFKAKANPEQKRSCIEIVAFWALVAVFLIILDVYVFQNFEELSKVKLFCLV
jgi:hypothetical protein